jgi:hypothetical protein
MLSNLSESFINNLGVDCDIICEPLKNIMPSVTEWQLKQGYFYDEDKKIKVMFKEDKPKKGMPYNKIIITDSITNQITCLKVYKDKLFCEKNLITSDEDNIKTSTYLFDEEEYTKKIYSFVFNDDYITIGIEYNKVNNKMNVSLNTNLDEEKVTDILSNYDILNIRMCEEKKDIADLLKMIYFDSFYKPKKEINSHIKKRIYKG